MATVLLGLLAPVTVADDIETSETFKVLTSSDIMGGSCDSETTQVDAMVPKIQALITAATNADRHDQIREIRSNHGSD
jgi:hypothetical protein